MDKVIVEQGRASMYGFVEPQTIQASRSTPTWKVICKHWWL